MRYFGIIGAAFAFAALPTHAPARPFAGTTPAGTERLSVPKRAAYLDADGRIAIIGSDTLLRLLPALNAAFEAAHPAIRFAPVLRGSSTGLPALTAGTTPFAPLGRGLWPSDLHAFRQVHGYDPTVVRIAYAGHGPRASGKTPPAVYVNARNPLPALSLSQIRRIHVTGDTEGDLNSWSQVGGSDGWEGRRIHLYGLRDDGGFASALRARFFDGRPFADHYEALPSREAVLEAVAADPYGIAFAGWVEGGAAPSGVRLIPISATGAVPSVAPTRQIVAAGRWPYAYHFNIYVDKKPGRPLEPFILAYLDFALSESGQRIIGAHADDEDGYLPLSPEDLAAERAKIATMLRM